MKKNLLTADILKYIEDKWIHYSTDFVLNHFKDKFENWIKKHLNSLWFQDFEIEEFWDIYINNLLYNKEYKEISLLSSKKLSKDEELRKIIGWFEIWMNIRYLRFLIISNEKNKIIESFKTDIMNKESFFKWSKWHFYFNTIGWFIALFEVVSEFESSVIKFDINQEISNFWKKSYLVDRKNLVSTKFSKTMSRKKSVESFTKKSQHNVNSKIKIDNQISQRREYIMNNIKNVYNHKDDYYDSINHLNWKNRFDSQLVILK